MEYLKHEGEFYKEIDLKTLDKKELIKLIKESVEYKPDVVINNIREYTPSYTHPNWWNNDVMCLNDSNLNTMETNDLIALCSNIC